MPRTRATRKADANRSQTTADKVKEVTEVTPKEHLQAVIRDMQCQIPRIIDLTCKKYEREALKCVRLLPDKSTIPPEIYNMPLAEFIIKGGTMDLVMQSLREEKMKEFVNESTDWEVSTSTSQLPGKTETKICYDKENLTPREVELVTPAKRMTTRSVANSTVKKAQENGTIQTKRTRGMAASTRKKRLLQEEQVDETNLVTPAMNSRSCTVVPSTVKRIPKQLEEVELMIKSKETGSPLNEKDTMEAIIFGAVDDCFKSLLPKLPKRAQTQAMKALEESLSGLKGRIRQDGNTVTMVTPSIASTRARRKK